MVRVRPFAAIRPLPNLAARVASVPYDVVSTEEARALAAGNPYSFLHIVRSEIDLAPGADPYQEPVYDLARSNLVRFLEDGVLVREEGPRMYLYRLAAEGHVQTGIVCCCHIEDYAENVVRRHEKTRPEKEQDRMRHILTLGAQAGPVFCIYRDDASLEELVHADVNSRPLFHFNASDGVTHTVWSVPDDRPYRDAFDAMEAVYVADGHHRAASALRAGRERRSNGTAECESDWFLVALFPAGEVNILPYNRLVKGLGENRDAAGVLERLRSVGRVSPCDDPRPPRAGVFCVYLDGAWHRLELDPASIDCSDAVASLDVALLQDRVLAPILGIGDPRLDPRIEFVGGSRGTDVLEQRVDEGAAAVAFSLHPTSVSQLLEVADSGLVMPPKSTWFEPKLRSGLLVHEL